MSNYSSALVFLESLAGYVICGLVAILGFVVIWLILTSRIDLSHLLSEKDGSGASMSRFQLLIFIFVIALSFSSWSLPTSRYCKPKVVMTTCQCCPTFRTVS